MVNFKGVSTPSMAVTWIAADIHVAIRKEKTRTPKRIIPKIFIFPSKNTLND
jgi:hypothetical protein